MLNKLLISVALLSKNVLHILNGVLCLFFTGGDVYMLDLISSRTSRNQNPTRTELFWKLEDWGGPSRPAVT